MDTYEYFAILNLLRNLGFKQDPKDLTKFSTTYNGIIKAQIENAPDQEYRFNTTLDIELFPDKIQFKYNSYAALDCGRLTWVAANRISNFTVFDFLWTYEGILKSIYNNPCYEFISVNYDDQTYNPRTVADVARKYFFQHKKEKS